MLTKFKPILLITVYEGSGYYLEGQRITQRGSEFIPLEAKPLTKSTLQGIANSIVSTSLTSFRCRKLIPPNLLYYSYEVNENHFIWLVKAHKEHLYFHDRLKIPDGEAGVPNLLFEVRGNHLNVYAVKTSRITPKTRLYYAPFHNVNTSGSVCLGNAKREFFKGNYIEDFMKFYEKLFWRTKFSEIHHETYSACGGLNKLWQDLISTDKEFPNEILKPTKQKFGDLTHTGKSNSFDI